MGRKGAHDRRDVPISSNDLLVGRHEVPHEEEDGHDDLLSKQKSGFAVFAA